MEDTRYQIETAHLGHSGSEIRLSGELTLRDAERLQADLAGAILVPSVTRVDLSAVTRLDGGAAAILAEAWSRATRGGTAVHFDGAHGAVASILALYTERDAQECLRPPPTRHGIAEHVGYATIDLLAMMREVLSFLGEGLLATGRALRQPRSIHWADFCRLAERHGVDGLPIVLLVSFLIGLITAFQAATQLHELGADLFVSELVGLSLTRELAPLMTAIVVAGRSGAAIAAELGTMRVSEEVDALRTLGLCPFSFLVFPRILALTCVLPLMTLLADFTSLTAGLITTTTQLDVSVVGYISQTRDALDLWDVFGGVLKAVVFGFIVSLIACERGLATTGGAEGVGRSTTAAVVSILFHLILMDTIFSILFQQFGI